jgi:hypothetical protein
VNGIDDLRSRRQPAGAQPRRMPAPLRPRAVAQEEAAAPGGGGTEMTPAPGSRPVDADPLVALGVRVPRSLDDRLAVLGVQLRMRGVRLTKAELVAHALRQLPDAVSDDFAAAVRR